MVICIFIILLAFLPSASSKEHIAALAAKTVLQLALAIFDSLFCGAPSLSLMYEGGATASCLPAYSKLVPASNTVGKYIP